MEAITRTFGPWPVRVFVRDGDPWFAAADVCRVLDIGNVSMAMSRLDDDERTLISAEGLPAAGLGIVSESGLYALVLGSRKPEAKAFKRWVTHEVLPSIRKTGSYATPMAPAADPLAALADPSKLRELLLGYTEKVLALEATVVAKDERIDELEKLAAEADGRLEEVQGAVELHKRIEKANGMFGFREAARALGIRSGEFVAFLLAEGYAYRLGKRKRLAAIERYLHLAKPLFHEAVSEQTNDEGETQTWRRTWITPVGLERFAREYPAWASRPRREGAAA